MDQGVGLFVTQETRTILHGVLFQGIDSVPFAPYVNLLLHKTKLPVLAAELFGTSGLLSCGGSLCCMWVPSI
jgi:hypothetical protein